MERDFTSMPPKHLKLLPFDYKKDRILRLKECCRNNQAFLNKIVADYQGLFEMQVLPNGQSVLRPERVRPQDIVKMRSTLRSFMREWSAEGKVERDQSFQPIMDEVEDYFVKQLGRQPFDKNTGERVSVLMPGCGLGRLVFDFALKGYRAQGNEFAYFCLLSSNFILNVT
jgi:carnosine N-methyltransferase